MLFKRSDGQSCGGGPSGSLKCWGSHKRLYSLQLTSVFAFPSQRLGAAEVASVLRSSGCTKQRHKHTNYTQTHQLHSNTLSMGHISVAIRLHGHILRKFGKDNCGFSNIEYFRRRIIQCVGLHLQNVRV